MTQVLVVGEALMDIISGPDGAVTYLPGGSAANVAVALARLGREANLHTCLGDDDHGRAIMGWLNRAGVRASIARVPETSTAQATLDSLGGASYSFSIHWAPTSTSVPAQALHFGSIGALLEPGARAVRSLLAQHRDQSLIAFDPNIRPQITPDRAAVRRTLEELLGLCDVVKLSSEDAAWLYPTSTPDEVLTLWSKSGPALVVLTLGADGAMASTAAGRRIRIDAPSVRVVDTIGAGDTFQGCLIDGLIANGCTGDKAGSRLAGLSAGTLEVILRRAARAAAITVSRAGADPPTLIDLA